MSNSTIHGLYSTTLPLPLAKRVRIWTNSFLLFERFKNSTYFRENATPVEQFMLYRILIDFEEDFEQTYASSKLREQVTPSGRQTFYKAEDQDADFYEKIEKLKLCYRFLCLPHWISWGGPHEEYYVFSKAL